MNVNSNLCVDTRENLTDSEVMSVGVNPHNTDIRLGRLCARFPSHQDGLSFRRRSRRRWDGAPITKTGDRVSLYPWPYVCGALLSRTFTTDGAAFVVVVVKGVIVCLALAHCESSAKGASMGNPSESASRAV